MIGWCLGMAAFVCHWHGAGGPRGTEDTSLYLPLAPSSLPSVGPSCRDVPGATAPFLFLTTGPGVWKGTKVRVGSVWCLDEEVSGRFPG